MAATCLAENDTAGDAMVSLRQDEWAQKHDWFGDFEYRPILTESQSQTCLAYTMDMKIRHVQLLRGRKLPYIGPTASADDEWLIGHSKGWDGDPPILPQPIFGYKITDPEAVGEKLRVVLAGGNHAREHPPCWVLHALIEFLVSDDPHAQTLREKVEFYVYPAVNPDGKMYLESDAHRRLMTVNSNPELKAAGETNHNRVWHTTGQFQSIDTVKAALLRDTGGSPDYLIDFHGIPRASYVFTGSESPLSLALAATPPGINQRLSPNPDPGMLRSWAESPGGLKAAYALTPELSNKSLEELFHEGRFFAQAFYHLATDTVPDVPQLLPSDIESRRPTPPTAPAIPGLKIHLDAGRADSLVLKDDGAVWRWRDSGGSSISFAPPAIAPRLVPDAVNGRPAVRFGEGTSLVANLPALPLTNDVSGITVFLVGRNSAEGSQTVLRIGTGNTPSRLRFMVGRRGGSSRVLARRLDGDDFQQLAGGRQRPNTWAIDAAVVDFAHARARLYVNGSQAAASDEFLAPGNTSPTDSLMFRLGTDHQDQYWQGDLAELLLFDRSLSPAECQAVNAYLSQKYGVSTDMGM
jgi:hypothetical protein